MQLIILKTKMIYFLFNQLLEQINAYLLIYATLNNNLFHFSIKNGVAHEVPKVSKDTIIDLIKDQTWSKLKPVNFLSNPFSVQYVLHI